MHDICFHCGRTKDDECVWNALSVSSAVRLVDCHIYQAGA